MVADSGGSHGAVVGFKSRDSGENTAQADSQVDDSDSYSGEDLAELAKQNKYEIAFIEPGQSPKEVLAHWLGGQAKWGARAASQIPISNLSPQMQAMWRTRPFKDLPLYVQQPPPGTYGVLDSQEKLKRASRKHNIYVEPSTFLAQQPVKAQWDREAAWYPGTITKAHADGSYDIKYNDGDVEQSVEAHLIRAREVLRHGDLVEARHLGGKTWYSGKIESTGTAGDTFGA